MGTDSRDVVAVYSDSGHVIGHRTARLNPQFAGGVVILGRDAVAASLTGTLAETTLAGLVLPAKLMGPNGLLRFTSLWSFTNSANTKGMRAKLAGNNVQTYTATTLGSLRMTQLVWNRGNEGVQVFPTGSPGFQDGTTTIGVAAGAVDTSQEQLITFTAQLSNITETITLEAWMVEVMPSE